MRGKLAALALLASAALLGGCAGQTTRSTFDGGPGAEDAGSDSCLSVVYNEAGCPATYYPPPSSPSCMPAGLQCSYPGQGDDPCGAAEWACLAGDEGGAPHWVGAQ